MFDIVIPLGPNDYDQITLNLLLNRKNIVGYNNIYIVTKLKNIDLPHDCIIIDENIFPFSTNSISFFTKYRPAWYFQQLIKLYAGFVIPSIQDRYLVIDADTFFLRPTTFINKNNICLYNFGWENHRPYFKHMAILHPDLKKIDNTRSGICHHMMFEKLYLEKLFNKIEDFHQEKFYLAFLNAIDKHNDAPGASEYEIYYNFMRQYHPDKIEIRQLKWKNIRDISNLSELVSLYDYISYHHYNRRK